MYTTVKDIAVEVGRLEKARITPQRKPKIVCSENLIVYKNSFNILSTLTLQSLHLSKSSTEEETEKELTRYGKYMY